jgi:S-adenosyl-L-methionine hydrolase (adenosine-forming)
MAIITLATDYGYSDGYNAAVIGVIKSHSPAAEVIEITNSLSSIAKTSLVLWRYYSQFPKGTIHIVVIDPTVGTCRRALAGTDGIYYFVGPDNGIFTRVMEAHPDSIWYEINPAKLPVRIASNTFHGRDIFAPAAALLSNGIPPESFSKKINDAVKVGIPKPIITANRISGEIIDIDSFGNLIININGKSLGDKLKLTLKGKKIQFGKTFTDAMSGNPVAYIGSLGFLEIALYGKRADKYFQVKVGATVKVTK